MYKNGAEIEILSDHISPEKVFSKNLFSDQGIPLLAKNETSFANV